MVDRKEINSPKLTAAIEGLGKTLRDLNRTLEKTNKLIAEQVALLSKKEETDV